MHVFRSANFRVLREKKSVVYYRTLNKWRLFSPAAEPAQEVYGDLNNVFAEWKREARRCSCHKPATISLTVAQSRQAVIVLIRGSVLKRDWMVNENEQPIRYRNVSSL